MTNEKQNRLEKIIGNIWNKEEAAKLGERLESKGDIKYAIMAYRKAAFVSDLPDSQLHEKIAGLCQKVQSPLAAANQYNLLGQASLYQGNFNEAERNYEKAADLADTEKDKARARKFKQGMYEHAFYICKYETPYGAEEYIVKTYEDKIKNLK